MLGALTLTLASHYSVTAVGLKLFGVQMPKGFTTEIVMLTFLSGVLLLFLGIIGEYVGRVYEETKGRPHYIVARVVGRIDLEDAAENEGRRKSFGYSSR